MEVEFVHSMVTSGGVRRRMEKCRQGKVESVWGIVRSLDGVSMSMASAEPRLHVASSVAVAAPVLTPQ